MTGPEHFKEAERLLDGVDEMANELSEDKEPTVDHFVALHAMAAIAQAHATLAVAAASIGCDFDQWLDVLAKPEAVSDAG